ncbi:MAG: acyl-[acyl-carrier-protein]--UDP-N-acetylglucosamine O-acyltransferase [Deltaproteobacteria bacterium]|nr:MAG: acyl-[acyl-carrier-protein]--UDP-N-acetylglucosamine O-acyltransferase [Deltaproteobacteria bacterium]
MIHPTAFVHPSAKIGQGVEIGPYSIIGPGVEIGDGTWIGSHVVIDRWTRIGENCRIYHHASIGTPPQHIRYRGEETFVIIGNNCIIREFVTIHRGTSFGGGETRLGDNNFIMAYAHIAHDCRLGNYVVMANAAQLAGHVTVEDHAVIGGVAAVHQFVRIGRYAFIGGATAVPKDIPPYVTASGVRAKLYGINVTNLRRNGFPEEVITALKRAYRIIFRSPRPLRESIEEVKAGPLYRYPEVRYLVEFLEDSKRGITR